MSDFLENIFDFDPSADGQGLATFEIPTGSGVEFFNPKPEGAKKYVATVRLLMNLASPKDSIVFKKLHWLKDDKGNFSADSMSTFRQFCPVSKAYFELSDKKTATPAQIELSKELKINKQYVVYVQVVADTTTPENVGKILPWKMPVDIYNKVEAWMNPSDEEIAGGKKAKSFFKPLASCNLIVTTFNKADVGTQTFRGYDVELTDEVSIKIGDRFLENTPEDQKIFAEHLKEHQTIDLVEKFGFVEPDNATKARIKALLGGKFGRDTSTYWQDVQPQAPVATQGEAPSIMGNAPQAQAQPAQVIDSTATPVAETSQPAQGTEQDLDAILQGIGQ